MRILIRTSKWAIWARRFGSLAIPLTLVPVLLHREQLISSSEFAATEAAAATVALVAIVLAVGAFSRLWVTGDQGWGKAGWGLFFGLVCLLPFAYYGYEAWRYPALAEVTTDFTTPLPLVSPVTVPVSDAQARDLVETVFPNARPRTYPIEATQMFSIVADLADGQGWDIRTQRAPPTSLDSGELNAIAVTLLGWRDEVVLRVIGTAAGSRVDMRSVPLAGFHDFGENGRRVEAFLLELDERITQLLRNAPQQAAPAEDAPDDATAPPAATD